MSSDFSLDEKWLKKLDEKLQKVISRIGTDRKTLDQVFDKSTLLLLGKFISDGVIDYVDFPISTGKEANIFRGVTPQNTFVAIKIYRTSTATFKHISQYIIGDPRFDISNKTKRETIFEWAKKEFKNLQRLQKAQVLAPKPIIRRDNVLIMQYLGSKNTPAPLLKDVEITNPQEVFDQLLTYMRSMYQKVQLVHADLSSYNILFYRKKPYIIDVGQTVLTEHPMAQEFLKRDIHNILHYFKKYNINYREEHLYTKITKENG